jgi:hypothetical protein
MTTLVAMARAGPDEPGDALPEAEGRAVTSGGRVYGTGEADTTTLLGDGLGPAVAGGEK